jgi:hypothetical protein
MEFKMQKTANVQFEGQVVKAKRSKGLKAILATGLTLAAITAGITFSTNQAGSISKQEGQILQMADGNGSQPGGG